MKNLVVVRHGEGNYRDPAVTDLECSLSGRGRRETVAAAAQFAATGIGVDSIVCSPAQRAVNTADIWRQALGLSEECIHIDNAIYEAERTDVLNLVRKFPDEADTVVLVGHNPGLTDLLRYFVGQKMDRMTPSSYAVMSLDVNRWSALSLRDAHLEQTYAPPVNARFQNPWQRFVLWRRQRVHKVNVAMVFLTGIILVLVAVALLLLTHAGK